MFIGPTIDLRIKSPDVGIPLLQTKFRVMVVEHISSLSNVYEHIKKTCCMSYMFNSVEYLYISGQQPGCTY